MARGLPAHPSRVVARVTPGTSRSVLETALDGVGAALVSGPNAGGWATVNLPPSDNSELVGETTLLMGMKTLQTTGVLEAVEPMVEKVDQQIQEISEHLVEEQDQILYQQEDQAIMVQV